MNRFLVDRDVFEARHLAALEADEARNNLMLGLLARTKSASPEKVHRWSFGEGLRYAFQTPPHLLLIGDLTDADCETFAEELRTHEFIGFKAFGATAERFAKSLAHVGISTKLESPHRLHTLTSAPLFPKCAGFARKATPADMSFYPDWLIRFAIDAELPEGAPRREDILKRGFDMPIYFWEIDGKPVAMAACNRETKNGGNISCVYTPPEFRARGYGGAITAHVSQTLFDAGKSQVFLYTDLRNPYSNRAYEKIGFRPYADAYIYKREAKL